jgi:hypothetical protein
VGSKGVTDSESTYAMMGLIGQVADVSGAERGFFGNEGQLGIGRGCDQARWRIEGMTSHDAGDLVAKLLQDIFF